jgi:hypothetical protein
MPRVCLRNGIFIDVVGIAHAVPMYNGVRTDIEIKTMVTHPSCQFRDIEWNTYGIRMIFKSWKSQMTFNRPPTILLKNFENGKTIIHQYRNC